MPEPATPPFPSLRATLVAVPLLVLAGAAAGANDDWPQWRGPDRDGHSRDGGLPATLPEELHELWTVEVGTGHSSPVVVGNRVYQFARQGDDEVTLALDLESGREIWRDAIETPYTRNPAAIMHGKGPKSTPVAADGVVCTLGITGRLSCLGQESGAVRFRQDFSGRFDRAWPDFGTAMSPILLDGRVIVHVGGLESGALVAVDVEDGSEVWTWDADPPGYASPVLVTLEEVPQLVTQSRGYVFAVDARTGRELWKVAFTTPYEQNSVTPLRFGDRLVISGLDQALFTLEPRLDGRNDWVVRQGWSRSEIPMYMSSPVLAGNLVFGLSDRRKGQLFCVDATTGEVRWTSEGRVGDNAALILAGDRLLVQTTEGELHVAPLSDREWSPEKTYTVADSALWAHPALLGDRILVKDRETLTAWSFAAP